MNKILRFLLVTSFLSLTIPCTFASSGEPTFGSGSEIFPNSHNKYIATPSLTITEPMEGDLIFFGNDLEIKAPIHGSIFAVGGQVVLEAPVDGNVRIAAIQPILSSGVIQGETALTGLDVQIEKQMRFSGALLVSANSITSMGSSSNDVFMKADQVTFGGYHSGIISLQSALLTFDEALHSTGKLTYQSVEKQTLKHPEFVKNFEFQMLASVVPKNYIQDFFLTLLGLLFFGWVLIHFTGDFFVQKTNFMLERPIGSFGIGLASVLFFPLLTLILLTSTLSIELAAVIGIMCILVILLSQVVVALYLGTLLVHRVQKQNITLQPMLVFAVGAMIATLLLQIPVMGLFLLTVVDIAAVGSFLQNETSYLGCIKKK